MESAYSLKSDKLNLKKSKKPERALKENGQRAMKSSQVESMKPSHQVNEQQEGNEAAVTDVAKEIVQQVVTELAEERLRERTKSARKKRTKKSDKAVLSKVKRIKGWQAFMGKLSGARHGSLINKAVRFRSLGRERLRILENRCRAQFCGGFYSIVRGPYDKIVCKRRVEVKTWIDYKLEAQRRRTELMIDREYMVRVRQDGRMVLSKALLNTGLLVSEQKFIKRLTSDAEAKGKELNELHIQSMVKKVLSCRMEQASNIKRCAVLIRELCQTMLERLPKGNLSKNKQLSVRLLCGGLGEHDKSREGYFYDFGYFHTLQPRSVMEEHKYYVELLRSGVFGDLSEELVQRGLVRLIGRMPANGVFTKFALRDSAEVESDKALGYFCMPQHDNYDFELTVKQLGKGDQLRGVHYWPCDERTCIFPDSFGERLKSLLIDFCKAGDARRLLADKRLGECKHTRHCSRSEVHDEPCWLRDDWKEWQLDDEEEESSNFLVPEREKRGHSLACLNDECGSELLFLKRLGVHFYEARKLLKYLSDMKAADELLCKIDQCLWKCDFDLYIDFMRDILPTIRNSDMTCVVNDASDVAGEVETFWNSKMAVEFRKAIGEVPEFTCACRILYYRTKGSLHKVRLDENTGMPLGVDRVFKRAGVVSCEQHIELDSDDEQQSREVGSIINDAAAELALVWVLDQMARDCDGEKGLANLDSIFLCRRCESSLRKSKRHSPISIFNCLELDETPSELACLSDFEKPLVCRAKCFQNIYRLGSVQSKMPHSDRAKAQKGVVVYYPLPLSKTLETVRQNLGFEQEDQHILVNGVPTQSKIVWQSLLDFRKIEEAIRVLKRINPEYKDVEYGLSLDSLSSAKDLTVHVDEAVRMCQEFEDGLAGRTEVSVEKSAIGDVAAIGNDDEEVSAGERLVIDALADDPTVGSMLTRIDENDMAAVIDKFTVHTLYTEKPDATDLQIYQMKRVKTKFLDSREAKLDALCFPVLYPKGRGGECDPDRKQRLRPSDFVKCKLLSAEPKYRRDHQYIFYLLHAYRRRAVLSGVFNMLRTTKEWHDRPVSDVVAKIARGDQEIERCLRTVFSTLRGSAEYWSSRRMDLKAMVRELGPPTWFLTLSAAEYDWPDMRDYLIRMNEDVPGIEKMRNSERCAFDPVSTSRHFDKRIREMLNRIIKGGALGECTGHYLRSEYQARGARHVHMVLWIKGAPRVGVDTDKEVLKFVQRYATCKFPSQEEDVILRDLVKRYQVHYCNAYCKRRVQRSGGGVTYKCRFDFPRSPRDFAVLRDPLQACKNRSKNRPGGRLYELPRGPEAIRVNDYNEKLLRLWSANMDLQFIGEQTEAVVNYIVSYITKKEVANYAEIWSNVGRDKSLVSQLYQFANCSLSQRECGIYEAVDILCGHSLFSKSHDVQYLNARPLTQRMRRIKRLGDLNELNEKNPESRDIFENNFIADYYPCRPVELERLSLYEFRKWYETQKKPNLVGKAKAVIAVESTETESRKRVRVEDPNLEDEASSEVSSIRMSRTRVPEVEPNFEEPVDCSSDVDGEQVEEVVAKRARNPNPWLPYTRSELGFVRKRSRPCVVSHPALSFRDRPEEYCYSMLLIVPFRNEIEALAEEDGASLKAVFEAKLADPKYGKMKKHHEKLQSQFLRVERNREVLASDDTQDNEPAPDEPCLMGAPVELINAMAEVEEMQAVNAKLSLNEYLASMNSGQRAVFDRVTSNLLSKTRKQFCQFVMGSGGTGKSYLIDAIRAWWKEQVELVDKKMIVTAPTGIAACGIGGVTLHRLLSLPIENSGKQGFEMLSCKVEEEARRSLRGLKLIVTDEISMTSNLSLAYIYLRLQQITREYHLPFGGVSILAFGDFCQLRPVRDNRIFVPLMRSSNEPAFNRTEEARYQKLRRLLRCIWASNLWIDNFTWFDELTQSMRQRTDERFAAMLGRLRYGRLTQEDLQMLRGRLIPLAVGRDCLDSLAEHYGSLCQSGVRVACLMPLRELVRQFNEKMLERAARGQVLELEAVDTFDDYSRRKGRKARDFLAVLKDREANISDTAGLESILRLCLGARVLLRRNLNVEAGLVNGSLGTVVRIEIANRRVSSEDDAIFVKFDNIEEVQVIKRVGVKFPLLQNVHVERKQFPLVLGWAMTVHKAQGITVDEVMVDAGDHVFEDGMTYVALSRVTSLKGLHLINFNPAKATCSFECIDEINRLRSLHNLEAELIAVDKGLKMPVWSDRLWYDESKLRSKTRKRKLGGALSIDTTDDVGKKARMTVEELVESSCNTAIRKAKSARRKRPMPCGSAETSNEVCVVPKRPKRNEQMQWPKFGNVSGVDCYANSSLQALLAVRQFENACANFRQIGHENAKRKLDPEEAMSALYAKYKARKVVGGELLWVKTLRYAVGQPFNSQTQQDALNFVTSLLEKLNLSQMFEISVNRERRCGHCRVRRVVAADILPFLRIPLADSEHLDFEEMMEQWYPVAGVECSGCRKSDCIDERERVLDAPSQMIMVIGRNYNDDRVPIFDNRPIGNFDPDRVLLVCSTGNGATSGSCVMRVVAAVEHFDDSLHYCRQSSPDVYTGITRSSGHYMSVVRGPNGRWLKCNDKNVEQLRVFDNTLRNVSFLILERDR